MSEHRVVIVGGGIVGCSIAYYLAKAGASPYVLERGRIGEQASGAAAGLLAPITESRGNVDRTKAGLESLTLFPSLAQELLERTGIDIEYVLCGILELARDQSQASRLRAQVAVYGHGSHELQWLSAAELRQMEPGVGPSVCGALFSPQQGHVNGQRLTEAFARGASSLGARIMEGVEVTGLLRHGSRITGVATASDHLVAEDVVLASGAWSSGLSNAIGVSLPVEPVMGQIVALRPASVGNGPCHVVYLDGAYLVQKRDGAVWVGATEEHVGFRSQVTAQGVVGLIQGACRTMPGLANAAFVRAWAGLRPGSPDGSPILGPAYELEGLTLATGHFRNGILLSPWTGQFITNYILEGNSDPLLPFFLSRFNNHRSTA